MSKKMTIIEFKEYKLKFENVKKVTLHCDYMMQTYNLKMEDDRIIVIGIIPKRKTCYVYDKEMYMIQIDDIFRVKKYKRIF